jgi:hypothetical protein
LPASRKRREPVEKRLCPDRITLGRCYTIFVKSVRFERFSRFND